MFVTGVRYTAINESKITVQLKGPCSPRVKLFYLITAWYVTSHIYVRTHSKKILLLQFVKIFSILEVTLKNRVFRSHFWKVLSKKNSGPFFYIIVNIIRKKYAFILSNLVLDFLKFKYFFSFFHLNLYSKAKKKNKFMRRNLTKRTGTFIGKIFFYILRPHSRKSDKNYYRRNIWNE